MKRFGWIITLLASSALGVPGTVCIEMPAAQAFRNAAAVVEVEIAEIKAVGPESRNQRADVRFEVIRAFKGTAERSFSLPVVLNSDMGYAYRFTVGERYILYLKTIGDFVQDRRDAQRYYYLGTCPGRIVGPGARDLDRERSVLSLLNGQLGKSARRISIMPGAP